jgi:hypothetical protein
MSRQLRTCSLSASPSSELTTDITPKLAAHSTRSPNEELALEGTAKLTAIFFLAGPAVDVRPGRCVGSAGRKLHGDGKNDEIIRPACCIAT